MLHSFYSPQRKRVQYDCSEPEITDQSGKKQCDINNIMAQYQKTRVFTHVNRSIGKYVDNTLAMPLEKAHEIVQNAIELFNDLPAQIRKLMDNDPTKLQSFLSDPENREILLKYKILEQKDAGGSASKSASAASVNEALEANKGEGERLPEKKA